MGRLEDCKRPSQGFQCGLTSGLTQTFIFNMYDRALFHSIANHRPFLDPQNWKGSAFVGVSPSFLQRAFSAGLYFPLEDIFRTAVSTNYAVAGVLVGLVGGLFTTPFNCVKYSMWSTKSSNPPSMLEVTTQLVKEGGVQRLMRGAAPTLYRDMTFGITYSFLRHQGDNGFGINVSAAFLATAISSPFNYARMKVYSPEAGPKRTADILRALVKETMAQERGKFSYLFNRFNVGWGALRVSLGMGVGSQIYNRCCE
jgi:hypothetical protein